MIIRRVSENNPQHFFHFLNKFSKFNFLNLNKPVHKEKRYNYFLKS